MKIATFLACGCLLAAPGCNKGADSTSPDDGTEAEGELGSTLVVDNSEARPGDVTVCPYSGKHFVVRAEHPTMQWGRKTYVFCSDFAKQQVEKDPEKYLGPA